MKLGATCLALTAAVGAAGQTAPPKFEVASIHQCDPAQPPLPGGDRSAGAGRGGTSRTSTGHLSLPCLPVRFFIQSAYLEFAAGQANRNNAVRLDGGPAWIDSAHYTIVAEAPGASVAMMSGPMMQALLEERFQLKLHRETREIPVYDLTVAGKEVKAPRSDGASCTPVDLTQFPLPRREDGQKPFCGLPALIIGSNRYSVRLPGATLSQFARALGAGRPVVDKTGITDKFDFQIAYVPVSSQNADTSDLPSIFAALADLGLKLTSTKGSGEFLVIDHIERPSEN